MLLFLVIQALISKMILIIQAVLLLQDPEQLLTMEQLHNRSAQISYNNLTISKSSGIASAELFNSGQW